MVRSLACDCAGHQIDNLSLLLWVYTTFTVKEMTELLQCDGVLLIFCVYLFYSFCFLFSVTKIIAGA